MVYLVAMQTGFALVLNRLCLTHADAAAVLGLSLHTVKSYSSGRARVPEAVFVKLNAHLERASELTHEIAANPDRYFGANDELLRVDPLTKTAVSLMFLD